MAALLAQLAAHAPPSAYVSLMADVPADRLHARFGFEPVAPGAVGMVWRRRIDGSPGA